MAGHTLELLGCRPEQLGDYLKGLGIFRLIAEQADPLTRAWWKDGSLRLQTKWSPEEVLDFFVQGIGDDKVPIYSPTPIFAPWGGRPGFYQGESNEDKNKAARKRLDVIRKLKDAGRFSKAQQIIKQVDILLKRNGWAELPKKKREQLKPAIIAEVRNSLGRTAIDWLDACLSLEEDVRFGFLYGTGGNEGSADITNNFWELIEAAVGLPKPRDDTRELLGAALFGAPRMGGIAITAGQLFPFAADSSNYGQSFSGASQTNPWDVILMMEGAVLFGGATTKRLSQYGKGKAAFPFMIDYLAADEPSGSIKDEARQDGQVVRCRAEFWMPLWHSAASLADIKTLLSEGRLQRRSGERTEHTLHAMEAIKSLGVSRGIDSFHRVALFERRGKGYYIASSLGFHSASGTGESFSARLAEIERFRQQVFRNLREGPGIPERITRARQRFHAALAMLLERGERNGASLSDARLDILLTAAAIEREVALLKDRARLLMPCPALNASWVPEDHGSAEYNIARAVSSIVPWGEVLAEGQPRSAVGAFRTNLLPVTGYGSSWEWDDTTRGSVWSRTAPLAGNLAAALRRRFIDAQRGVGDGLPLWSPYGAGFEDLLAFWHGILDEQQLIDLVHGLSLIGPGDWNPASVDAHQRAQEPTPDLQTGAVWFGPDEQPRNLMGPVKWRRGQELLSERELQAAFQLPRVYHLLKLCFVGGRLPRRPVEGQTAERTGNEPFPCVCLDVLSLVEAGRVPEATQVAARRLRADGYPAILRDPDMRTLGMDIGQSRRLAAMLLIPVRNPGVLAALAIKAESTM